MELNLRTHDHRIILKVILIAIVLSKLVSFKAGQLNSPEELLNNIYIYIYIYI